MDGITMIKERRSVRKFNNEKVDRNTMKEIVSISRWAPSWANYQIARYTLVDDEVTIKKLTTDGVKGFVYNINTLKNAKGVAVPLQALLSFLAYMHFGIGLREDDAYWNVADPGWAYGLYCGVIAPLLLGHAITFYEGPFTVESTYRILSKYRITNLAAAPTACMSSRYAVSGCRCQTRQFTLWVRCHTASGWSGARFRAMSLPVWTQSGLILRHP